MPCLITLLGFFFPRIILAILWVVGFIGKGYEGWFWPLLGFIFLPVTTLVYGLSHIYGDGISGWWMLFFILAVLVDLTGDAGAAAKK